MTVTTHCGFCSRVIDNEKVRGCCAKGAELDVDNLEKIGACRCPSLPTVESRATTKGGINYDRFVCQSCSAEWFVDSSG